MSKLPVIKPKEIIRILKKYGFVEIRSKGSHIQFKKGNLNVTVPFHNKDIKLETLRSILRQAKISTDELKNFS